MGSARDEEVRYNQEEEHELEWWLDDADEVEDEGVPDESKNGAGRVAPAGQREKVDIIAIYLKDISRIPLLAPEEERALAVRVRQGDSCAKARLAETNTRLVISIAKGFTHRGLDMGDLIQEGNLGLLRAIEKFDPDKGFRFSTYATWWIRQAIQRALRDHASTIRVPVHAQAEQLDLKRLKEEFQEALGRKPTLQELADALDVSVERLQLLERTCGVGSLEKSVGEEGDETLQEHIADQSAESPSREGARAEMMEAFERALEQLTERERDILRLRFGLEDGERHRLEEVARKYKVTRERIRQIELKAIEKLRHPTRQEEFKRWMEIMRRELH
jgi:RNA polymerase primary sigma factor